MLLYPLSYQQEKKRKYKRGKQTFLISYTMSDGIADKVTALGQRLKISGAEVGRKVTSRMSSMSVRMREFLQGPNEADQIVESATSANLDSPDWSANLEICDRINTGLIDGVEIIRAIKKRIVMKQQPGVQYLAMVLLEVCVKNCERGFADVAAERVLDEMVRVVDDPETIVAVRKKVLVLIEAWGESVEELQYLPVYEVTYKVAH
jgi:VHS domain